MAQTAVSSCVLSIITSFSSGTDVFKKLRESSKAQRRVIKKNGRIPSDQEVTLRKSLRQGPEDIRREYQRGIDALGDKFATGDGIAQSTLAEVLLRLNTGLVNMINTFLTRDKKDSQLNYESLTLLSDRCRVDTCRILRQLYRRMLQIRTLSLLSLPEERIGTDGKSEPYVRKTNKTKPHVYEINDSKKNTNTAKQSRARGPMLAKVVIKNSTKPPQIALVKSAERKKKSTQPTGSPRRSSQSSSALDMVVPMPQSAELVRESVTYTESRSSGLERRSDSSRNLSLVDMSALTPQVRPTDSRATQSTTRLDYTSRQERHKPDSSHRTEPLPLDRYRRRKETPTYYSIASGSTRLGEIPLHKWAEPYDFDAMSVLNREAAKNGWPVNNATSSDEGKKTRPGVFRIFQRNRSKA